MGSCHWWTWEIQVLGQNLSLYILIPGLEDFLGNLPSKLYEFRILGVLDDVLLASGFTGRHLECSSIVSAVNTVGYIKTSFT